MGCEKSTRASLLFPSPANAARGSGSSRNDKKAPAPGDATKRGAFRAEHQRSGP